MMRTSCALFLISLAACTAEIRFPHSSGNGGSGGAQFSSGGSLIVDHIAFAEKSYSGQAGNPILPQPSVVLQDSSNSTVSHSPKNITLSFYAAPNCTVVISPAPTFVFSNPIVTTNGIAAFSSLVITSSAVQSIGASDETHTTCVNVNISPGPPDPTESKLEFFPSSVAADDSTAAVMTLQLRDMFANPITSSAIVVQSSRGAADSVNGLPLTTEQSFSPDAFGNLTANFKSGTMGASTITVTASGSMTLKHRLLFLAYTPILDIQASYAHAGWAPGDDTVWADLMMSASSNDMILENFDSPVTNWFGNGGQVTATDPYSLEFDSAQYLLGSTFANSNTAQYIEAWVNPGTLTGGQFIFGDADSGYGMQMLESKAVSGELELQLTNLENYVDAVMDDEPIGFWRLNETSGTIAASLGTIPSPGTYESNVTLGLSGSGPVADQDASASFSNNVDTNNSSYVHIPFNAGFSGLNAYTICAWVNTSTFVDYGSGHIIFSDTNLSQSTTLAGQPTPYFNYSFGYDSGGHVIASAVDQGGTVYGATSHGTFTTGSWNYLCAVWNGSSIIPFINGEQDAGPYLSMPSITMKTTANSELIGAWGVTYENDGVTGNIANVEVYAHALSAARISAHYSAATVPVCRSTSILSSGAWAFLGAAFSNASQTLQLYVNGSQECHISLASSPATLNGSLNPFSFGDSLVLSVPTPGAFFSGRLGEMRMYNQIPVSAQVNTHYTATQPFYP